jgi:hypothetical protein
VEEVGGIGKVAEHLPSMQEALSTIPNTTKKKGKPFEANKASLLLLFHIHQ